MALPTAAGLFVVAIGLLLERPTVGLMGIATSAGPGGRQLRRFAVPAILLPVVLGLLVAFPLRTIGNDALAVVVAVLASAMTLVGLLVLTVTAASLNRTYEALESSRARARALVDEAPDAIFVADLGGRYLDVNGAACRMLGYARDELIGKSISDVILPDDAGRLEATKDGLLRGDASVSEWTLLRRDGSQVVAEVSAKIFSDGRWQAQVRDISERKRLERELRTAEAEQKFLANFGSALVSTIDARETVEAVARQIVGGIADACSVESLDEEGELHDRAVAHRDPALAAVCRGLEKVKLDRSRPYLEHAARVSKQPVLITEVTPATLDTVAQAGEHRRLMRELNPRSVLALPLLAHGGMVGSLVFISTTTGRRYTQNDVPFAQEVASRAALAIEKARLYTVAQHAIRMRDDVLSVVAHDLRNPLGTILLQAGLLRRGDREPAKRSRRPAEVIERAATRMNHLIQDLLDVARMEGGRLNIQQERVSPQQAVAEVVQAQEPLSTSASLELRLDLEPDLPDLWADRDRLHQIFQNLIGNAIKFTDPGGCITVGATARDGDILFWIADTGPGIGADDLPHVFERLWQGSTVGLHGAGLGLPIVKGLVEAHGGRVWVESALGEGTTFFFTMPTATQAQGRAPEPAPPSGP
jgi:PAS domain S-box-containing protein